MSAGIWSFVAYAIFATIVLILYALTPKKFRWITLLVGSIIVAYLLAGLWILFIFLTAISIYLFGIGINKYNNQFNIQKEGLSKDEKKVLKKKYSNKKRMLMLFGVLLNILVLALLKYFDLPIGKLNSFFLKGSIVGIAFPILGISYYTLEAIAYLMDVNRGKYEAEKNFFKFTLFLIYFPKLVEGPINRYDRIKDDLFLGENLKYDNLTHGSQIIIWGFFKKIVIADRLNIVVNGVFNNYNQYSGAIICLTAVFYAFQLYCDFSGYIDIARGVSKLFGINLEKNFERPFFSTSVGEFWRRWHMSLGSFLRDYVFYTVALSKPYMAFNKKIHGHVTSFFEKYLNSAIPLLFVWLLCGIWHGAGSLYIVYGMYYYVILMIGLLMEPLLNFILKKLNLTSNSLGIRILRILRTFMLVCIGLMMFRSDNLKDFGLMFAQIFKGGITNIIASGLVYTPDFILMFVGIFIVLLVELLYEKKINLSFYFDKLNIMLRWTLIILFIISIFVFGAYGFNYEPVDPMYAIY